MSPPEPTSSKSLQLKRIAVFLFAVASVFGSFFFMASFIIAWISEDNAQSFATVATQMKLRHLTYYIVYILVHFIGIFAVHTQRQDAATFYDALIFLILIFTAIRVALEAVNFWLFLNGIWNVIGLFLITLYKQHLKRIESQYEVQP